MQHLLRDIPGRLLIIWDRVPIHRNSVVKGVPVSSDAVHIHLEQLHGYALELNLAEGIWNYLK